MTSTFDQSRTLANVRTQSAVRVSIGSTTDVLMIDATAAVVSADDVVDEVAEGYAAASRIPRGSPGFVYVQIEPHRMQVWAGPTEFPGRTVMRNGQWLQERSGDKR